MIPYKRRHSVKLSIQGKSVRFGYKAWTLASSDSYVYASDIYSGKSKADHITDSSLGQKGKVVTQMPQVVDKGCPTVYFDNFLLCLIFAVPSNDVRILCMRNDARKPNEKLSSSIKKDR